MSKIKTILNKVSIIGIVISIILNIFLLSTDVFKGDYIQRIEDKKYIISFDKVSYKKLSYYDNGQKISDINYGFYQFFKKYSISNATSDVIILYNVKNTNRGAAFDRISVFAIKDHNSESSVYYCSTAIFLQVIFVLIDLASIIAIILLNKERIKEYFLCLLF